MAGFSTDYSDVKEGGGGGILPIGEYEMIIKYAGEDTVQTTGTVYINVTMVVRNDVDQQYKNKYFWDKLWHRKEPTPADLGYGGYSSKQINSLSKAAGLPNNKKYDSLADWCEELGDKCVRVTVEHEEFKGKTQAKAKWVNESKHPDNRHEWKQKEDAAPAPAGVRECDSNFTQAADDDDEETLPF